MHLYLPEGLDLSFLPKTHRPAAQWMLSSIYTRRHCKRLRPDAWIRLHSKILERMMGRSYPKIKAALKAYDIIEDDGRHVRNVKSRGYRLKEPYRSQTHRRVELTGKVIRKRLQKHRDQRRGLWCDVHSHLYGWLSKVELAVRRDDKRYVRHLLPIDRIKDGDWFLYPDKYGRVHSNVTNLKSSLRRRLKVNNAKLVEIDISNSQPLMLSLLLLSSSIQTPTPTTLPLTSAFLQMYRNTLPVDVQGYIDFCEGGGLYEALAAYLNLPDTRRARNKVKRGVIKRVLYCRNRRQVNRYSDAFGELFPTVLDTIKAYKRDDYRHLPRLLQSIEADLVIHRVCTRLMTDHPAVPVLTVHDSLLTTEDSEALVTSVLLDEAGKLGIRPAIKVKRPKRRCK